MLTIFRWPLFLQLGTHLRGKNKREDMTTALRKMR